MKIQKRTVAIILFGFLVYAGMVTVLALPLLQHYGISEDLRIDATNVSRGQVGQPLHLTVEGTGFDQATRFMLMLDSGNQQAIISTTETSGGTNTILRDGHTLYLGDQKRKIQGYDISHPEQPKSQASLSHSMFTGKPTALLAANGTIWGASGYGEIAPLGENPHRLGTAITDLATDAEGILYAAAPKQGLVIFRPQAGNKPLRKIGSLDLPGAALSIVVVDRLAYVSSAEVGLHICDLSNPENPRLISTLPWPGSNQNLAVKNNFAFLSSANQFVVIDVQNSQQPRVLAQLPLASSTDMVVHDNLVLLATRQSGLLAVDITDPAKPFLAGHLTPGDSISCLSVDGERAYLGTDNAGLLVVDLNRLSHHPAWRPEFGASQKSTIRVSSALQFYGQNLPKEVLAQAESQIPPGCDKYDVAEIGQTTYLASTCGLIIIDRNEPAHIKVLQQPLALATEIVLVGTTTYISGSKRSTLPSKSKPASQESSPGLQVFDVSNPGQPRAQGFIETGDRILSMRIQEDRAYLAVKEQGIVIVDVHDPEHPQVLGIADLPWPEQAFAGYLDIYLNGEVLYVANGRAGLHVFDVSDPRQPKRIAAINTPGGWVNRLAGDKNQLFTYNFNSGLQMYDIGVPEFPRLIGTLDRFSTVRDFTIGENTLQLEFSSGLLISRALPLPAEDVDLHGSTRADLRFAAPVFAGEYLLYAFNQQGRRQLPGIIHIEANQK